MNNSDNYGETNHYFIAILKKNCKYYDNFLKIKIHRSEKHPNRFPSLPSSMEPIVLLTALRMSHSSTAQVQRRTCFSSGASWNQNQNLSSRPLPFPLMLPW